MKIFNFITLILLLISNPVIAEESIRVSLDSIDRGSLQDFFGRPEIQFTAYIQVKFVISNHITSTERIKVKTSYPFAIDDYRSIVDWRKLEVLSIPMAKVDEVLNSITERIRSRNLNVNHEDISVKLMVHAHELDMLISDKIDLKHIDIRSLSKTASQKLVLTNEWAGIYKPIKINLSVSIEDLDTHL